MRLLTELYTSQKALWPQSGKHILAYFNTENIIVYQAYRPSIGLLAAEQSYFGGQDFQLGRMSWIKTNFLWMMYRSGWGRKADQEVTLAITLRCADFNQLLAEAVQSSFIPKSTKHRAPGSRLSRNRMCAFNGTPIITLLAPL